MKPITGLVLGSLLLPIGLVSGLLWVPSSVGDAISYGAADACVEASPNGSGCWTEVSATVTSTYLRRHPRGNDDWVVVLSDLYGQQRPHVAHRSVFKSLANGQTVVARFWKGSVALIRVPAGDELPTDDEPGRQLGFASLVTVVFLLGGVIFFLGALGVHRHAGSWTRSASRLEWGDDLFDAVSPPLRRWLEAIIVIPLVGLTPAFLVWEWLDVPLVPAAGVGLGLAAFGWVWLLHQRARTVMERRSPARKPR